MSRLQAWLVAIGGTIVALVAGLLGLRRHWLKQGKQAQQIEDGAQRHAQRVGGLQRLAEHSAVQAEIASQVAAQRAQDALTTGEAGRAEFKRSTWDDVWPPKDKSQP